MQKQPFPVRGGSKKFEDWGLGGLKNFRTGGVTDLGGSFPGGISTPCHDMEVLSTEQIHLCH